MKEVPMLEKFAVQSLVEYDGELIFSKEKFAQLIVQECIDIAYREGDDIAYLALHFGVER